MSGATQRHHSNCLNCGASLVGPWCAQCGQRDPHPDVPLHELLHDIAHEFTHWDGKVLGTIRELVSRPGQLTVDFLAGRRARWLPPFRLYLIVSVAYFLSVPAEEMITHRGAKAITQVTLPDTLIALDQGARARRVLRPEVAAQLDSSALGHVLSSSRIERVLNEKEEYDRALRAALPKIMFVLLPLFALFLRVAYRATYPGYVPHLYFSIHLHAFAFVALTLTVVLRLLGSIRVDEFAAVAFFVVLAWYTFAAIRRVYGGTVGRTLLRGGAVGVSYAAAFMASLIALAIVILLVF
jgi:hypothetical protein